MQMGWLKQYKFVWKIYFFDNEYFQKMGHTKIMWVRQ